MPHTWALVVVPLGLGLLGFIEPCTLGSSLLWLKYLEGKPPMMQRCETVSVAVTRSLFIGGLGTLAALIGSRFLSYQRGFWVGLGVLYVLVGVMYLARMEWLFARSFGPSLARARGAVALGLLFGLNIPACAAPLLAALMAASAGVASVGRGFLVMAVFGLALSLPLVLVVFWEAARLIEVEDHGSRRLQHLRVHVASSQRLQGHAVQVASRRYPHGRGPAARIGRRILRRHFAAGRRTPAAGFRTLPHHVTHLMEFVALRGAGLADFRAGFARRSRKARIA